MAFDCIKMINKMTAGGTTDMNVNSHLGRKSMKGLGETSHFHRFNLRRDKSVVDITHIIINYYVKTFFHRNCCKKKNENPNFVSFRRFCPTGYGPRNGWLW